MFLQIQQFADLWRDESAATKRVMGCLTDAALDVQIARRARSAGETAWHITTALRDIGGMMGLPLSGPRRGDRPPRQATAITDAYDRASAELLGVVTGRWIDRTLLEVDDVYGERWTRGRTLYVLVAHEIHHRGQLTAFLRAAGLTVPGVYGPSGDEDRRPVDTS